MVTVVVLTVAGAVVPLGVVVVGVVVVGVVDGCENRAWRNSVHESRYSTASPSETSSMAGDTA
jgi:hypothetical protein